MLVFGNIHRVIQIDEVAVEDLPVSRQRSPRQKNANQNDFVFTDPFAHKEKFNLPRLICLYIFRTFHFYPSFLPKSQPQQTQDSKPQTQLLRLTSKQGILILVHSY
jgi:hypothetical protein